MAKATEAQIAEWKKKHRTVIEIEVDDKVAYLHNPDRTALRRIGMAAGKDSIKRAEMLLELCWLAGDEEIKKDDQYFFAAIPALEELDITSKEAVIKKL
jgi:hypothetical protein